MQCRNDSSQHRQSLGFKALGLIGLIGFRASGSRDSLVVPIPAWASEFLSRDQGYSATVDDVTPALPIIRNIP